MLLWRQRREYLILHLEPLHSNVLIPVCVSALFGLFDELRPQRVQKGFVQGDVLLGNCKHLQWLFPPRKCEFVPQILIFLEKLESNYKTMSNFEEGRWGWAFLLMELQLILLSRWQYRYMDTVMAVIWGHNMQIWAAATHLTSTESSKMLRFASKRVQNSNKIRRFTSKIPIPAAIPPTMLACSLRISRICSKQPWGWKFSSYKPPDPWPLIRSFLSCRVSSPAPCSAVPRRACRGSCLSSSSSVADYLRSPSQTWSPQSRCSWWNHSTWAGRSRNSCQYSIYPSSILQPFRKRIFFSSICSNSKFWSFICRFLDVITFKISTVLLPVTLPGTWSSF